METLWRWFYRCVIAIGCLFAILIVLFSWAMSRPFVHHDSGGNLTLQEAQGGITLSGAFPTSARNIRYIMSSVGIGGRFKAYRFSGAVNALKTFANSEFANHWHHPAVVITANAASPFDTKQLADLGRAYGVNLDWMVPEKDAIGSVYTSADGQISHRPTIFVDEKNDILYFVMTD